MENLIEITTEELTEKLKNLGLFMQGKLKEADAEFFNNRLIRNYTFSDVDLGSTAAYNVVFDGCVFEKVNISRSWLNAWQLKNCSFSNCAFFKAEIYNGRLENCKFEDCNFNRATIQYMYFDNCKFLKCSFSSAKVLTSELVSCIFLDSPDAQGIVKETKTTDVKWS